jgi:hypothetical protein
VKEVETQDLTVSLTKVHSGLTITSAVCYPVQMRESRRTEQAVGLREPQPWALGTLQHLQLVPKRQYFEVERGARTRPCRRVKRRDRKTVIIAQNRMHRRSQHQVPQRKRTF